MARAKTPATQASVTPYIADPGQRAHAESCAEGLRRHPGSDA